MRVWIHYLPRTVLKTLFESVEIISPVRMASHACCCCSGTIESSGVEDVFFLHVTLSYHERMQEYKTIFIQSGKTSSVLTSPPFFLFNYQENCMSNYVLEISFFLFTFQFRAAVIS